MTNGEIRRDSTNGQKHMFYAQRRVRRPGKFIEKCQRQGKKYFAARIMHNFYLYIILALCYNTRHNVDLGRSCIIYKKRVVLWIPQVFPFLTFQ